jgi:hypothetical protein
MQLLMLYDEEELSGSIAQRTSFNDDVTDPIPSNRLFKSLKAIRAWLERDDSTVGSNHAGCKEGVIAHIRTNVHHSHPRAEKRLNPGCLDGFIVAYCDRHLDVLAQR